MTDAKKHPTPGTVPNPPATEKNPPPQLSPTPDTSLIPRAKEPTPPTTAPGPTKDDRVIPRGVGQPQPPVSPAPSVELSDPSVHIGPPLTPTHESGHTFTPGKKDTTATVDTPDDARGIIEQCVRELRGQIGSVAGEAVTRVANTLQRLGQTL